MAKAKDGAGHNSLIDPVLRKEFIERRDHWQALDAAHKKKLNAAKEAAKARKLYEQEIGRAGFTLAQIKVSLAVLTPEGEAEFKARMAQDMLAAAYTSADFVEQLSLFFEPDRTPAIDRARHEGALAATEGKAHRPPYDASVPQYKAWSDAFYAEQERQVLAGIKKKEGDDAKGGKAAKGAKAKKAAKGATGAKRGRPAKAKGPNADPPAGSERTLISKAEKEAKAAAKAPKDAQPPRTTPAVAPVTRSSLKQQRESAREQAESYFTKSTEPAGNA